MIAKDEKSSLISNNKSVKLIKTSLIKNESFSPMSDKYSKLNHCVLSDKASSPNKLVAASKLVELDAKNRNSSDVKKRRNDINKKFIVNNNNNSNNKNSNDNDLDVLNKTDKGCRFTLVFDPNGRFSYWIGAIVSCAFLYNFWVIIYRFSFNEINQETQLYWMIFDYTADILYILDIIFNFHTGFLEEGVLQTDPIRLRHHYMNTTRFYIDCLCLLPLDILYLSFGFVSIFRCFRLVKVYKIFGVLERTERHFAYPNVFRTLVLLTYLFSIFHWNACLSVKLSNYLSDDLFVNQNQMQQHNHFLVQNNSNNTHAVNQYLKEFYSSIKLMTLVTAIPNPTTNQDYIYSIFQLIGAIIIFASIMGHVSHIVNNLSNARKEFQSKLDAVKRYMSIRRVPKRLQVRVIKWFDFLWLNHKSADDNQILNLLPYKLRAEIAIHVHLDTLKRVEIFQNTEAGFLNELVLRLKPVLFSPGDFICRKGEVGKEMYIVNSGKLQVISENGKIILATLKAGSYFGEISILNMGAHGNRRTASVKSVGYSDLFCLSKGDLWEVLKEYPAVRVKLEAIAVKRLEKHKKPLSEIVNMSRSKSLSNLDKMFKQPKEFKRHGTLPSSLLKRTDISLLYTNKSSVVKIKPMIKIEKNLELVNKPIDKYRNYASEIGIMNESIQMLHNEINQSLAPISNITTNNNNTDVICRGKAVVLDLKRSESDLKSNNLLMQEVDRLKRMIDFLKNENDNLKRNLLYSKDKKDVEIRMELDE